MILLGGVDEAGLGPLLGPLCVGAAGLLVPLEHADADPWELLASGVSREPVDDRARLVVGDSKKVFTRNERGHRRLEATVLAFARRCEDRPSPPRRLADLSHGGEEEARWTALHPWRAADPAELPRWCSGPYVELREALAARALEEASARLAVLGVRVVEPGELNRELERSGTKSAAAWRYAAGALARLLEAAERAGAPRARIVVDRQGGRARYGPLLARALPRFVVHLVEEREGRSTYRLTGPVEAQVVFAERAELESLPTALASCAAKYAREVSMELFNHWFAGRVEGLAPTAGYTTDGRRFLADLAERAPGVLADLDRDLLVRRR